MGQNGAPISVLVVEDEIPISNLVADCLVASGFAVHEVTTAAEALRYIDSGADVDVLFTDVKLPGGMDGAELATRARIAAGNADRLRLRALQTFRYRPAGAALVVHGETL